MVPLEHERTIAHLSARRVFHEVVRAYPLSAENMFQAKNFHVGNQQKRQYLLTLIMS